MGAEGRDYLVIRDSRRDDGEGKVDDLEMIMEEDHITESFSCTSSSLFSPSFGDASATLSASDDTVTSSVEDLLEDSATSSSSESSIGAPGLFDLSELMSQLPVKRGLSKFYPGKSQSFTSLASVTSLEDLAKKGYSGGYGRRIKSCKSFPGGLNTHPKSSSVKFSPKSTISKKPFGCSSPYKGGALSLSYLRRNVSNISSWNASNSGKPPVSPVQIK